VDKGSAYEWRGSRWQSIGPLPAPLREIPFSAQFEAPEQKAMLAGTQRYLYKETPLGLYRVAWDALATR